MSVSDSTHAAPVAAAQSPERRRRRSEDPITALHYQLSFARAEADLEALVLVDDSGCLVAGAGAWPLCEELAAYAPLLAHPGAIHSDALGSSLASMSRQIEIRTMMIDGVEATICGRGGSVGRTASIARAAAGCRRILCGAEAA
ncbi:MAG: hypothetical protein ABJE95_05740 [Byssovorax sp.]